MSNFDPSKFFLYKNVNEFLKVKFEENLDNEDELIKLISLTSTSNFKLIEKLIIKHKVKLSEKLLKQILIQYSNEYIFKSKIFSTEEEFKLAIQTAANISFSNGYDYQFEYLVNLVTDDIKILIISNNKEVIKYITNPSSTIKDYIRLKNL